MTPGVQLFRKRLFVARMQSPRQVGHVLAGVIEIQDTLRQGKVAVQKLFQTAATIRERDLLLGVVPTDVRRLPPHFEPQFVQLIKTRGISHLMRWQSPRIVLAAGVVNQAHVGHAALGLRAARALLAHARRIETHVRARFSLRVALPRPDALRAELGLRAQQLVQPRAGFLGRPLDSRFAQPQARHFHQHALGGLAKRSERAGQGHDLRGGGRQIAPAHGQLQIPRHLTVVTAGTVVIGAPQSHFAQEADHSLAAPVNEPRGVTAGASTATTVVPLF